MDEITRFKKVMKKLDWDVRCNRMPERDIREENREQFTENLFEVVSPNNIKIHVDWLPPEDLKGRFYFTLFKDNDLDVYFRKDSRIQLDSALNFLSNWLEDFSSPDWREKLEIYAERKYTTVGDKVFYRDEEDGRFLICIDKNTREQILRKNLADDHIKRIEKHPENKGLFIFFKGENLTEEDYEHMKRTNLGYFTPEGDLIWWAEPYKYKLLGGKPINNYTYAKWKDIVVKNEVHVVEYNKGIGSLCMFDIKTGKLKGYKQVVK